MDIVLWLCPSLPTETLKWLSSLPILMQESFWWWQCSDRYIISLSPYLHAHFPPPPPFSPSLISLMVSLDVKHHVYLLTYNLSATWSRAAALLSVGGSFSMRMGHTCYFLILSRFDYCNCLLMGTHNFVIQPLQKILNFAARLVLLAPRHHNWTPLWKNCTGFPFQNVLSIKSLVCVSVL